MATNLLAVVDTEDLAIQEIFGEGVKKEVQIAKKTLQDFADYYLPIRRDYNKLVAELDACTKKGQAAEVMAKVRRVYI